MAKYTSDYKLLIPKLDLSVEKNTGRVPSDNKFHVVYKGNIVASYHSKREAEERFHQIVEESGYKPEPIPDKVVTPGEETIDRYFQAKDLFWAEGPKYRPRGGKGR